MAKHSCPFVCACPCKVVIIDDDAPGWLGFESDQYHVCEGDIDKVTLYLLAHGMFYSQMELVIVDVYVLLCFGCVLVFTV